MAIKALFCQAESHRRAAAATASGKFKDEIVPVPTKVRGIEISFPSPQILSWSDSTIGGATSQVKES